ncbi:plasmid replication protein RepB [Aeromonas media]|uniref:plasmid replication protein RepB n=1 Tax=Aeromonas media TaxID=651 RepID=UPI003D2491EC
MTENTIKEVDAKLLFDAGALERAMIIRNNGSDGYNLFLAMSGEERKAVAIERQRGGLRIFKSIDAAVATAKNIGFNTMIVSV